HALELRWAAQKTQREAQEPERQLKVLTDDRARLRANLKEMPATAAAYQHYPEKFDSQENQIKKFQSGVKQLQAAKHRQQKELGGYLAHLIAGSLGLAAAHPGHGPREAGAGSGRPGPAGRSLVDRAAQQVDRRRRRPHQLAHEGKSLNRGKQ